MFAQALVPTLGGPPVPLQAGMEYGMELGPDITAHD